MEPSEPTAQSKRTNLDWFVPLYTVILAVVLLALPSFFDAATLEKVHYSQTTVFVGAIVLVVLSLLFPLVNPIERQRPKD